MQNKKRYINFGIIGFIINVIALVLYENSIKYYEYFVFTSFVLYTLIFIVFYISIKPWNQYKYKQIIAYMYILVVPGLALIISNKIILIIEIASILAVSCISIKDFILQIMKCIHNKNIFANSNDQEISYKQRVFCEKGGIGMKKILKHSTIIFSIMFISLLLMGICTTYGFDWITVWFIFPFTVVVIISTTTKNLIRMVHPDK